MADVGKLLLVFGVLLVVIGGALIFSAAFTYQAISPSGAAA